MAAMKLPPPAYSASTAGRPPSYFEDIPLFPNLRQARSKHVTTDIESGTVSQAQAPLAIPPHQHPCQRQRPRRCRQTLRMIILESLIVSIAMLFLIWQVLIKTQGTVYQERHDGMAPSWFGFGWTCPETFAEGLWDNCTCGKWACGDSKR